MPKKHTHRLNHYRLQTLKFGELMPVDVQEVLPGDHWTQQTRFLLRAQPMLTPPMHPVYARTFSFYCPFRILADDWEDFIMDKTMREGFADRGFLARLPYKITPKGDTEVNVDLAGDIRFYNSLGIGIAGHAEYLKEEPGHAPSLNVLFARAYNKIWNEYFRDQDIDTPVPEFTNQPYETGSDTGYTSEWGEYKVLKVRWAKDYYTTARLQPQAGEAGTAPVLNNQVKADDISQAFAQQRYAQRSNRYGSNRYVDWLAAHFGVRPNDARLQRPEFLGANRQVFSFSEVLSTADTRSGNSGSPVGGYGGHGITAQAGKPFRKFIPEHGCIITLMCIIPKAIYVNSTQAHFLRGNYRDGQDPSARPIQKYFKPEFANIGWQPVYSQELLSRMLDNTEHTTSGLFGWQPAFQNYRFVPSYIAGEFRDVLKDWHFGRNLAGGAPQLNSSFLECNPPLDPFVVKDYDHFLAMIDYKIRAKRPVPLYARS